MGLEWSEGGRRQQHQPGADVPLWADSSSGQAKRFPSTSAEPSSQKRVNNTPTPAF